jgi:enoyl-CoA hydratase/carnithine racemase
MTVHSTLEGHVAVLTLDFPEHHNALSTALVRQLLAALRALDPGKVRAIVVAAKGKFFSAGANIPDLYQGGWLSGRDNPEDPVALFETLATHRRPVIAAVTGPALGGGFELSLSCDLAVAADNAWFAAPEVGLGVIPNTALARLTAIVGRRRALEIMMTRRRVTAGEALALGLVNEVVPPAEVVPAAVALANRITADAPPAALAAVKQGVDHHGGTDWTEVRASLGRLPQAEWQEGLGAFVDKRKPDYERFWR